MKNLAIVLLVPFALSACGKGKTSNPVTNLKQAAEDPSLQGRVFESACAAERANRGLTGLATGMQTSIKSSRIQYKVEGANVTRTTLYFTSENCDGPIAFTFNEIGTIKIHDQKTQDGGRFIDMNFKTVKAKINSDSGAQIANAIGMCNSNKWSHGQEEDVTSVAADLNCLNGQVPRVEANVYRVQSGVLYLGSDSKAQIETTNRPKSLDHDIQFRAR